VTASSISHAAVTEQTRQVDMLIVGAGLSGVGAACHLQTEAPGTSYAVLEARPTSGGTWDLFRYPGIRSDSDMFTLGYSFRPWSEPESIAGGDAILRYIRDTAREYGVDRHIRYNARVLRAEWSSADAQWTVAVEDTVSGATRQWRCGFLYICSGYYSYDEGYAPTWPGADTYRGRLVHPQHWPKDIDLAGKRVVVVGSGATAVTLVPALAQSAEHVTMLQRSPSYVMPFPSKDPLAQLLRKVLPPARAYRAIRWKNIKTATAIYSLSRSKPTQVKALLRKLAVKRLPVGFDVDTHFTPSYQPWDQRMCLVPEGDFFAAIKAGSADVVTDHIEGLTADGLTLRSGQHLAADVIVTATGLNLLPLGGIELIVDGEKVAVPERVAFKGMMLDGVPNLAFAIGYTNASWTLKVDLVSSYVSRLWEGMKRLGQDIVTPQLPAGPMDKTPFIDMSSGYFERSRDLLMLQGDNTPWRLAQHYGKDSPMFKVRPADEPGLEFGNATATPPARSNGAS
jgi:monooxygenase